MTPRYCTACVLPDTRPGVRLDRDGVCAGCRSWAAKACVDWERRAAEFDALVADASAQRRDHDCVIPVSGGKDSFWQVATCLERGVRPLCATYVYPGRNELGERNLRTLLALGVDHVELRVDPDVERAFVTKAFRTTATSGLPAHLAIYGWPLQVAVEHGIPLVVYGENSAVEYGTEDDRLTGAAVDRRWLDAFGVTGGTTAADWVDDDLTRSDLAPFTRPDDAVLAERGVRAVFLGHYFRWDPMTSRDVAVGLGFEARVEGPRVGHYDFVNVDDDLAGVHHHPKWHKFGITRSWDTLSMEIRAGRLSRAEAVGELRRRGSETPWPDIDAFCAFTGLSTEEYFDVLERFRNRDVWSLADGTWRIDGFLVDGFEWPAAPVPER